MCSKIRVNEVIQRDERVAESDPIGQGLVGQGQGLVFAVGNPGNPANGG